MMQLIVGGLDVYARALATQICPPTCLLAGAPISVPCCRRSDSSWVKINAGQYGYYRVRYSLSNGTWAALAGAARWAGAGGA